MNIMNSKNEVEYWPENNPITPEELNEWAEDIRKNWKAQEDANAILNKLNSSNDTTGPGYAENESQLHNGGIQGWVCPICNRTLAPWVSVCNHGKAQEVKVSYHTGTAPEYLTGSTTC